MYRYRSTALSLALALVLAMVLVPTSARAAAPPGAAAAGDPVVTDTFKRSHRSWTVGNTVVDGFSTPSVRYCLAACQLIELPLPPGATGGARVESVTGPRNYGIIATGVSYTDTGALATIWRVDPNHRPRDRWLVDADTLPALYGTGYSAVAVTGVSEVERWIVLRKLDGPARRGNDRLVQGIGVIGGGAIWRVANPVGCAAAQGQSWNDLSAVRLQDVAFVGHCGAAGSTMPRVYLLKSDGLHDVTRNLPGDVVWTTATVTYNARYRKSGLLVTGEPVGGGPAVNYRLYGGSWVACTRGPVTGCH